MPWRISYRHPLRPDDGGMRYVPNESEAAAEKLRLELRGYTVSEPTRAAALRLIAQTEIAVTGETVEASLVGFQTAIPGSAGVIFHHAPELA